jgi:ribosomal protein S18 acetylase RimI-like enzyme
MTTDPTTQRILARPYRGDDDFWRVRRLLVETYPITPTGFNWDVRRWDGQRFYVADPAPDPRWAERIYLWERGDGQVVGAVLPEGNGDAHLQLHPDYRHIEGEMIAWAEEHLAAPTGDGTRRDLIIFVYEYDAPRRRLLEGRGYEKTAAFGVIRRLRFGSRRPPEAALAEGYTLRTTRPEDRDDCQRIADLLNAAFRRDFHNAEEFRTFTRMAPSYRNDLDLVAEAPDGSFAAYVGVPYDEANRSGIFEPVCTHPDHRRQGLALALMIEGLHRLKALGAADVLVGTGDMEPANRLYEAVGFSETHTGYFWRKVL